MESYNGRGRPRYTPGSFAANHPQTAPPHFNGFSSNQPNQGYVSGTGSGGSNSSSPGNTVHRNNNNHFQHPSSLSPNPSSGRHTPLSVLSTNSGASSGVNSSSSASSTMSSSTAKRNQNQYDRSLILEDIRTNLNDLKTSMSEMKGLNTSNDRTSGSLLPGNNNSLLRPQLSNPADKKVSLSSIMNRNRLNDSPPIEVQSLVDVDEAPEIDQNLFSMDNGNSQPIITSPDETDYSDPENAINNNKGLTSPNLVSSMNPGLSLTSSIIGNNSNSVAAQHGVGLSNSSAAARMSVNNLAAAKGTVAVAANTTSSSIEERKSSSSKSQFVTSSALAAVGANNSLDSVGGLSRLQTAQSSSSEVSYSEKKSSTSSTSAAAIAASGGGLIAAEGIQSSTNSSSSSRMYSKKSSSVGAGEMMQLPDGTMANNPTTYGSVPASAGAAMAKHSFSSESSQTKSESSSARKVSTVAGLGMGGHANHGGYVNAFEANESHSSASSSSKKMSMSSYGAARGGALTHIGAAQIGALSNWQSLASPIFDMKRIMSMMNTSMSLEDVEKSLTKNDFEFLSLPSTQATTKQVESAVVKAASVMAKTVENMKNLDKNEDYWSKQLSGLNDMMAKAWQCPSHGYEMGNALCDILSNSGGLDILIDNITNTNHEKLKFNSAKLLQHCLETENRGYVVEKGLGKVVGLAKHYLQLDNEGKKVYDESHIRVGTGILEHLFKHHERTCGDVIAMGGLDMIVNECKSTDIETLRHCASGLANVAMYGGAENQEAMITRKVPSWLFPLAFQDDDTVKYYACLAIAVLVANKEIEAAVQKSGTLDLIDPFVQSHTPKEFADICASHSHGQSPIWLKRLIPVLMSQREEARNLAAFHFCMEAEIKKEQNKVSLFKEIGAIESLKRLASSPSGISSKYAAQTLRLIGEEVPHKLSQQVPTWTVEDVCEWVKQIGFPNFSESFQESRVDGDLLLQLTDEMLKEDIQMRNGILRRRFLRELNNLKRMADYSSCDPTNLNSFLSTLGPEYCVYTYEMLNAGIDRQTLLTINEEQLLYECGIKNKIHRLKIQQGVKVERGEFTLPEDGDMTTIEKNLDVFISYRRSNGSQLASLLKVHLEIRNFSVFLDVDRLEAGKFDNNLLANIRAARNLVLVCTPGALERCYGDIEQRDWIHKEIACALDSNCKIIPVFDNFTMPESDKLPETMRAVTTMNGVKWVHDYQDACVDKIDRWIRGESSGYVMDRFLNSQASASLYGSLMSDKYYDRQNTYQRTISQDSQQPNTSSNNSNTCSDTEVANIIHNSLGGKD